MDHSNVKKATFELNADLHHALKIAAAQQKRDMRDIVEEAVSDWLRQSRPAGVAA